MNPERLLALARDDSGATPEEAFQITLGVSFEHSNQLSEPARHAVPLALDQVKAILLEYQFRQHTVRSNRELIAR